MKYLKKYLYGNFSIFNLLYRNQYNVWNLRLNNLYENQVIVFLMLNINKFIFVYLQYLITDI